MYTKTTKLPGIIVGAEYNLHRVTEYPIKGTKDDAALISIVTGKVSWSPGATVAGWQITRLPDWLATGKSLYCPDTRRVVRLNDLQLSNRQAIVDGCPVDFDDFLDRVSSGYYVKPPEPAVAKEPVPTKFKWAIKTSGRVIPGIIEYSDRSSTQLRHCVDGSEWSCTYSTNVLFDSEAEALSKLPPYTRWHISSSGAITEVETHPYPSASGGFVSYRPKGSTSTYVLAEKRDIFDTELLAGKEAELRMTRWTVKDGKVIKVTGFRSYGDQWLVNQGAGSLGFYVDRKDLFDTEAEALEKLNTKWVIVCDGNGQNKQVIKRPSNCITLSPTYATKNEAIDAAVAEITRTQIKPLEAQRTNG